MVEEAAQRFDEIARDEASRIVGSGGRMRKGKRTIQLGTRTKITNVGAGARAVVRGTPSGPWVWIEDGTEAHLIGAVGKRGRRRGKRFLSWPGAPHPLAAPVEHPGAKGQHTWTRAVDTFDHELRARADKIVGRAINGR